MWNLEVGIWRTKLILAVDGDPGDGKDGKDGKNGGDGKGDGKANGKGKVDNELQQNQATDGQIEAICDLLRSNKVDQALQLMQKEKAEGALQNLWCR